LIKKTNQNEQIKIDYFFFNQTSTKIVTVTRKAKT